MKFHALIFTLLFSLTLHAECLNNNTSSFLDNLFKANCSECSCMTASFSDELKPEKSNLDNKINNQVKELVNTKIELLIGNMAKLDSFMQIENNSLPDVSTCSLTSLEQKLNCPNLEKMILKKGLGSKKNFLNQIGKKFAALQDVNSNNSCIGQDALNYLVAKKSISATDLTEGTLAPIAKITDETSLREFREAYYSKISSVPILYYAFGDLELFHLFQKELDAKKGNLSETIKSLTNNPIYKSLITKSLSLECDKTFKDISEMICKEITLPPKDFKGFLEIAEKKDIPNIFFEKNIPDKDEQEKYVQNQSLKIKGASCYTEPSESTVSILTLMDSFSGYFASSEKIQPETLQQSFSLASKKEEDLVCQLANFDCPKDQCSNEFISTAKDCSPRKTKALFSDVFAQLCTAQDNVCSKGSICQPDSSLANLKEYEENLKKFDITATIATTTTTKDEKTGKETTTTTYETVRRVSSFAKTFHGESKPAGTTLAIPTPKENVAVHVENAAGKDITREVAPEIAARQAERVAPQHAQTNRAVADSNTSEFRSQNAEPKNSERAKWSPSFDPTPTTGRIGDSEMAGYREIIDSLRKTKEELAQTKNADEKKRLQDEIDRLEKEKNRAIAAAAPGSRSPIKPEEDESQTAKPKRNNAVTRDHTAAPTAPTNNPEAYGNVDTNNSPTEAPAANSRPATPANTKAAVVTGGTNSNKKGTGANADASVAVNTAVADLSKADLQIFKEFPVQSQDEIKLSELLAQESEILKGGKAFSIYEVINGKKELVKFEPIKDGATIRFRPIATNENKNLIKKLKTDRLLISTNLNDALKSL